MAIYKIKRRKGDVYHVRLTINNERISKTFDRKIDAVNFAQQAPLDSRLVASCDMTFEEAANEWLDNHARPRKAPGTVANNEATIKNDLMPEFGRIKLAKIEARHIDRFIGKLLGRMSNASINNRLELIRAVFNYHLRRRAIIYNPMDGVAFLKVDPKPMSYWSKEEATTFLEHAKTKYAGTDKEYVHLLYLIALNTGMRLGEALALKWSAVDFTNGHIIVCRSLCHHTGKLRETTKGRRIRYVPMNNGLIGPLRAAWELKNGIDWILHTNGSFLDQNNLRKRYWKVDIKESGVSCIRIHDMRHTYASHFMMNGGDIFKLQAILGHADIRTTMRYAHFSKAYVLENANIVCFGSTDNVIRAEFRKAI